MKLNYLFTFTILALVALSVTVQGKSEQGETPANVVVVDGRHYAITIRALRDTGPVTRMDAAGLIVKVDVFSVDRKPLPENFQILNAMATAQTQSWDMTVSKDITLSRYFDGTGYSMIFRKGPSWSMGELLTIELRINVGSQALDYSTSAIKIEKN